MTRTRLACVCVSLLLFAACGEDAPTGDRPASTASITIAAPSTGDVVTGDTVEIVLELDGGEVVDRVSRDLTPDEGHIHLSVNGAIVSETFGLTQEIELEEPGRYLLEAEFVALDHGPFNPRVIDSVTFTAE